jgi:hypothetical protein
MEKEMTHAPDRRKVNIMKQLNLYKGAPVHLIYEKVIHFIQRKYKLKNWQSIITYRNLSYYAVYYGLLIDALLFFSHLSWPEILELLGGKINMHTYTRYTVIIDREEW